MEQEAKHKPWGGILGTAAGVLALCLALTLVLAGDRARAASAAAILNLPRQMKSAPAAATEIGDRVVPLGRAVGIKLFSDGVLVVGLSPVETSAGQATPGRDSGLKTGDIVTHMNGEEVNTIEQVQALVAREQDTPMTLQVRRGDKTIQLSARAAENSAGTYQLGVWLRDSMAGIGTLTFYEPESGVFAALGHGINDVDTSMLMPLESGSIMAASVSDVKKGLTGQPGELHGTFDLTCDLGTLYANTEQGIFGVAQPAGWNQNQEAVEVASRDQVQVGRATILSNIQGDQVEEYEIEITHLYPASQGDTRNMMIRVTDQRLLETTGGIVQGMSGSPILQDGRLVGAVTHVLINDPSRGYGILAEHMLDQAACAEQARVS